MKLPLSNIAVVDRRRKEMGDVAGLAASIKANGLIQPVVVRVAVDEDLERFGIDKMKTAWVLVAGGRRYAAHMLLGEEEIKVEPVGNLPILQQKIYELEENLNRKNLEWDEEVLLKEEINELRKLQAAENKEQWSQKQLARELGETPANTSRDLQLAKALREDPSLRDAPTKASAVRQLEFKRKIDERTAALSGNSLVTVVDRIHNADMRDFVRTLPTASIDLCFTDFPFGIDYNFAENDRNTYEDSSDQLRDLLTDVIPEIIRVTKRTGWLALMMGSTNYGLLCELIESCCCVHFEYADTWWEQKENGDWVYQRKGRCNSSAPKDIDHPCEYLTVEDPEWIWHRPNSRNPSMHPHLHAQNQYEKIAVVNRGDAVLVDRSGANVLVHDAVYEDRIHEMQRPHSLCLDIIKRFTISGERVLDLCFGSGSALAAAAELGRDFIGCDINPANMGPALAWIAEHIPSDSTPTPAPAPELEEVDA